ncbi:ATP-binding cassette domain-containing protein [Agrobacterium tumefaciens]|nr:ATP-binding cassette domain-containing protein [Agrobacterium tumefaciens]NTE18910.1 ATP-binding cassette domain-containing protein [Agrobacterium tumefaciens]
MSNNVAIKVENLSKAYQLGQIGTGTISRDLERWYARMRGKEDPFLRIGESNNQHTKSESDVVWSLKDVNFEIEQGDAVGIIGRNGAGKSTLLKILSKVTAPTAGRISGKGRIASLLEVGTGFHPELSGRENIFLNGAILGMRKREIQRKLDEIVDFAGIERYLDTPVKRYSSGMYVRLAFAVAAHLESEILIVDEVLAVGDAEFQKKCLGKMGEVSKGEGRTVLFVSHNMGAIKKLCNKGLLLSEGKAINETNLKLLMDKYLKQKEDSNEIAIATIKHEGHLPCNVKTLSFQDDKGNKLTKISLGMSWGIKIDFSVTKPLDSFIIALGLTDYSTDLNIRTTWSVARKIGIGEHSALFIENRLLLAEGNYSITIGLSENQKTIQYLENVANFSINNSENFLTDNSIIRTANVGLILNPMEIIID